MPLYNFKLQFVPNVVAGLAYGVFEKTCWPEGLATVLRRYNVKPNTPPKRQTIRACRKRQTKPGETLYLYTGCRTKQCIKLGEAVCKGVECIRLSRFEGDKLVVASPESPSNLARWGFVALDHWAQKDGFETVADMLAFFDKTHGPPFHGELITW